MWAASRGKIYCSKNSTYQYINTVCVERPNSNNNKKVIHVLGFSDKVDVVRTLLDHKANVEVRNRVGYTPLILAAFFCHIETCKVLIEKGKAEIGTFIFQLFVCLF